jgi:hypothetical protein
MDILESSTPKNPYAREKQIRETGAETVWELVGRCRCQGIWKGERIWHLEKGGLHQASEK